MAKIGIGLFGTNGHQIQRQLQNHPQAKLVAVAAFDPQSLPDPLRKDKAIHAYDKLDQLLADDEVQLVSFCSPRRRDQAAQAIRALEAGKDVYAEKPCAMTEEELDAIIATAHKTGRRFHEMANGVAQTQPFLAMRHVVESGRIGDVVQVFAQKSYPYHDQRPQDEDVDGGLIGQNAGHALRFIEFVGGSKIRDIQALETGFGNPKDGGLMMASTLMMTLENGGVAAAVANYLNAKAFGTWGNEELRVFGTKGFVETTDGATKTRLVLTNEDRGPLDVSEKGVDYFDAYVTAIVEGGDLPRSLEDELHPTRMTIRAKASAVAVAEGAADKED